MVVYIIMYWKYYNEVEWWCGGGLNIMIIFKVNMHL